MEDKVYQDLMSVGLSEKEARVYIANTKLGKSTVQKISKLSKVNRATTYVLIDILIARGLVSTVVEGKKKYFVVDSPTKLALLFNKEQTTFNQKEAALKYLIPELTEMFENTKGGLNSKVKFYNGDQGLKVFREELLRSKDKEVYAMYNYEEIIKYISNNSASDFGQKKVSKKIATNVLVSTQNIEKFKKFKLSDDPEINIVDITKLNYKEPVDISLFGNKLFITSLEENLLTTVIHNNTITGSIKSLLKHIENGIK